jgi:hypothetical protein
MPTTTGPAFPVQPLQPGGYSVLDPSALQAASQIPGAPVVAVPGDAKGGKPNTALRFGNVGALKNVLRSGAGYETARAAFLGGASTVVFVRLGTPTQSSAALAGATGTPVTLTSIDYGSWTAQIKRTVAANNKLTVSYTDANAVTWTETFAHPAGSSATAQQLVDAINGKVPGIPASKYVTAAVTTGTMPLTTAAQAALTTAGTDDSSIDASDWTAGLAVLETENIDLVAPATGDATIHAQVLAHCNAMSSTSARKERVAVFGGILAESVATAAARMPAGLQDKRAQLVYPGGYLFNDAGTLTLYDPYVLAGFTAGMHAALPDVATSLVGRNLGSNVVDVEKRLSSIPGGDLDVLLAAGLTPIGVDPAGGFQLVDSLSGYSADLSFRDFHKIRTADYTARQLRSRLEAEYKGQKNTGNFIDRVRTSANAILNELVAREILVGHNPADASADPATGTITYVQAPVVLPDTNKFILLTVALQPASALAPTS